MYFAVESLSLIDPMYTWSLEYFIKIFKVFIDESEKTTNLDKRVKNLIKEVTLKIY
jgi:dynein heavy chain